MQRIIEVLPCSILDAGVDVVVNASNEAAVLGGGVSQALSDECGGEVLQREMKETLDAEFEGKLEAGDCMVTSAGTSTKLRFVLHVPSVDRRSVQTSSADRVRKNTESAIRAAAELGAKHGPVAIAFPLLAAGSGGLSPGVAAKAMVDGLRGFFKDEPEAPVTRVVIAVPEDDRYAIVKKRVEEMGV